VKLIDFRNFKPLVDLLKDMGAELVEKEYTIKWTDLSREELEKVLGKKDIEIELDDPNFRFNLEDYTFEYKGIKVLVYIRDQYYNFRAANENNAGDQKRRI